VRIGLGIILVASGVLVARPAEASDGGVTDAGATSETDGQGADGGALAPTGDQSAAPRPLTSIQPVYTPEAVKAGVAGDVILILTLDEAGQVTDVAVESGLPFGLTESAVAAARAARFAPARDRAGRLMAVRIRWIVHFTLPETRTPIAPRAPATSPSAASTPPPPPPPANVERYATGANGALAVTVREKGTGKYLPGAILWIEDVGELIHLDAGAKAERLLPPGAYVVSVRAPGHQQEERIERIRASERLERTYFIPKERLNEYETVIQAVPPRAETGVVTLQAEEIHGIPGTFGDPFRAVMLLPGVASPISGLGYPVIRGEAPGQTGTFIDDLKVPLLYHLGFLNAVVHPLFLESLDFHPGNFPAEFGRFTGGMIRAKTTGAPEERQTMLEADLIKFSAFHAQPFKLAGHAGAITAAARYGTFTFLARAFDPNSVLTYWDFQTRVDLRTGSGAWRLLILGANDGVGDAGHTDVDDLGNSVTVPERVTHVGFNRADLRYRVFRRGRVSGEVGMEAGPDYATNSDPAMRLHIVEWIARPRAFVDVQVAERLKLRAGVDTLYQTWPQIELSGVDFRNTFFPNFGLTYGAFVQAEWQPTPAWLIAPGVRSDLYDYHFQGGRAWASSVDPRLSIRRRLRADVYLKGGLGLYHSPPRFLVPVPGLEGFGLRENGLNESVQASAGVEAKLPWDVSIDGQVYINWLRRVSEYALNTGRDNNNMPTTQDRNTLNPDPPLEGRSYGLELIARRRLGNRLFGWFTYTLARSERYFADLGWRPADFDQTQLINGVASYALGRSWTVSGVFHYNTGRPVTPETPGTGPGGLPEIQTLRDNRNLDRLPSFWRIDARIEKREAFDTWYLDFYIDWLNISLQREITEYRYTLNPNTGQVRRRGDGLILTIPTFGLRFVF
jgi:TonB family protein